jgi:hypothetical protein
MSDNLRACRQAVIDAADALEAIGRSLVPLQGAEEHGKRVLSLRDQAKVLVALKAMDVRLAKIADRLDEAAALVDQWDGPVAEPLEPDRIGPVAALPEKAAGG